MSQIDTLFLQAGATVQSVGTRLFATTDTTASSSGAFGIGKVAPNPSVAGANPGSILNGATTSATSLQQNNATAMTTLPNTPVGKQPNDKLLATKYLMYPPSQLGSTRYPHYMVIYINVNSKSSLAINAPKGTFTDLTGLDKTNVAAIGGTTQKGLQKIGIGSSTDSWVASHKRLAQAIALPMPVDVTFTYAAEYGQLSTGGILGSLFSDLASGKGISESLSNAGTNMMQNAPGAAIRAGATVAGGVVGSVLGKLGGNAAVGAGAGAALGASVDAASINAILNKSKGQAVNERLEQMFKQMQFRNFTFTYTFAPRDLSETYAIQLIVDSLRLHMHPEIAGGAAQGKSNFLIMPDEFDIEFRFANPTGLDSANEFVQHINTCALAGLTVNDAPLGQWVAFKDGAPSIIALQLHFIELQPLTREDIQNEINSRENRD